MDVYSDVFRWHEKLVPLSTGPDGVLLACDGDALWFSSPDIVELSQRFAHGESLAAYCRNTEHSSRLPVLLYALESLLEQGHVRPCSKSSTQRYAVPDVSAPVSRLRVCDRVDAINLSCGLDKQQAVQWACDIPRPGRLTVVYCDDLLDPRLQAIDRSQRLHESPWLLVKPTGLQACIGPVFRPRDRATACWHCLAERLRRNQPVRTWWTKQQGAWPGTPVRCDEAWVRDRLEALLPLAPRLMSERAQQLLSLDAREPTAHAVVPRPQCPECGTPELVSLRQRCPIVPGTSALPERAALAQATVGRLRLHVSPLCGVVTQLEPVSSRPGEHVWRSSLHKTPRQDAHAPSPADFTQACLGRGSTPEQAQASALCEALERHAACYQGDEDWIECPATALDAPCVLPQQMAPVAPCTPDATLRWVPAWSVTRQARCYLPLGCCHAHAPAQDAQHIGWTSNGCAAGNTLDEAILHGLLEVTERDAVAVWWYQRIARPAFHTDAAGPGPEWDHWVLDITHDLGLPVAAAVARRRDTGRWALGFGCAPDAARACERALTELSQLIAVDKHVPVVGADAFLHPHAQATRVPRAQPQSLADCVAALAVHGLETIVLDCSRPDIALHTVKVVVPGLSHIWPQFSTDRIEQVPIALGWRDAPQERNPQPLFV